MNQQTLESTIAKELEPIGLYDKIDTQRLLAYIRGLMFKPHVNIKRLEAALARARWLTVPERRSDYEMLIEYVLGRVSMDFPGYALTRCVTKHLREVIEVLHDDVSSVLRHVMLGDFHVFLAVRRHERLPEHNPVRRVPVSVIVYDASLREVLKLDYHQKSNPHYGLNLESVLLTGLVNVANLLVVTDHDYIGVTRFKGEWRDEWDAILEPLETIANYIGGFYNIKTLTRPLSESVIKAAAEKLYAEDPMWINMDQRVSFVQVEQRGVMHQCFFEGATANDYADVFVGNGAHEGEAIEVAVDQMETVGWDMRWVDEQEAIWGGFDEETQEWVPNCLECGDDASGTCVCCENTGVCDCNEINESYAYATIRVA